MPAWLGCSNTGLHRAEYGVSLGSDAGQCGSYRGCGHRRGRSVSGAAGQTGAGSNRRGRRGLALGPTRHGPGAAARRDR